MSDAEERIERLARASARATSRCLAFEPDLCDGCNDRLETARHAVRAARAWAVEPEQVEQVKKTMSAEDWLPTDVHGNEHHPGYYDDAIRCFIRALFGEVE